MGLHADSFSRYATADGTKRYNAVTGLSAVINPTGGRGGRGALLLTNSTVSKTMTAEATWCMGFGLKAGAFPSTSTHVARLEDAGSSQLVLQLLADGTLRILRGSTTLGTSTFAISVGADYHVEWKSTIDNTTGSSELRINGATRLTISGTDTQATSTATANQFVLASTVSGLTLTFSDLVVRNGSDASAFLGDRIVECIYPNAAGNYSQWTPSTGATQYEVIDDATPSMADYLSETTAGERTSVGFSNLATASGTVEFAELVVFADKDDGGTRQIELFTRISGANYDSGVTESIAGSIYYSHAWGTNPATGLPWTISEINAFEAGVELIA